MTTDRLSTEKLHWIIETYDRMQLKQVPDVPTLLFEEWVFSEEQVRRAIGLPLDADLMDGLEAYLEVHFGISDLA